MADARHYVLQRIAHATGGVRFGPAYSVMPISQELETSPSHIYEVLWGLVGEGLIFLNPDGQGSGTDNWRWQTSEAGRAAMQGSNWEPHDVDGYLKRLRTYRPQVDAVAVTYVAEALRAFNARCYLATSVMLGVASESVINGLGRAIVAVQRDKAQKLDKLMSGSTSRLAAQFEEMRKQLEQMDLPEGLADRITLDAVADLLRVSRNNAGHPTGATVDEDTARIHLTVAGVYLQKMTKLKAHLEAAAA